MGRFCHQPNAECLEDLFNDFHLEFLLSLDIRRALSIILCHSPPYSLEAGSSLEPRACGFVGRCVPTKRQ